MPYTEETYKQATADVADAPTRCEVTVLSPTSDFTRSAHCAGSCPVAELLELRDHLDELTAGDGAAAETVRASLEAAACSIAAALHGTAREREEMLRSALGMARAAVVAAGSAVVRSGDRRRLGGRA
ncbi:hypothetical protein [Streptomyces antimycoticus]|uniref:hypothetical protein n=1 Tax=Streptomyces antimycoticus TaxID=68175 RepID=UPI001374DA6C|nr:hypothetical protein [Streptomyces antimycoticus]